MGNFYDKLGASASKSGLHAALKKANIEETNLFCRINSDLSGDPEYASFIHADGAGTKSIIAYLLYKETGNHNYFKGLAQDALVMNIDDAFCLGNPSSLVLANTIGRNKRLIDDNCISSIIEGYVEQVDILRKNGINIELSGGETADIGDVVRTVIVDAVLVGRVKRSQIINPDNISHGDIILGLESSGQASYETFFNSGIGSNGLTLARHALINNSFISKYPEIIDEGNINNISYSGPFEINKKIPELNYGGGTHSVGEALLSPTRTFTPLLNAIYNELGDKIHASIHLTGGGLTKVLRFGKNKKYIKDNLIKIPEIFQLIKNSQNIEWKEMYQVFNMGQRFELYFEEKYLKDIQSICKNFNIHSQVIGHVEDRSSEKDSSNYNEVYLKTDNGEFTYTL